MTSDAGVERVVEQQFHFHCSCGAAIETNERKETCWNCAASIEVIACHQTPKGKKYTLRIRPHESSSNREMRLWPPVYSTARFSGRHHPQEPDPDFLQGSTDRPYSTRQRGKVPDIEKNCVRLGLLILSAPFWVPLLVALCFSIANTSQEPVEQDRSDARIIGPGPKPTDCGWFSGCHYETRAMQIRDRAGRHILLRWQRVID